jgi:hypothetical protein
MNLLKFQRLDLIMYSTVSTSYVQIFVAPVSIYLWEV